MSGGGKLARSETVTVRLDPRLNYLMEMAARKQRRTKSAFIEWLISQAVSADDELPQLWDVEPARRLVLLGEHSPYLLTFDEEIALRTAKREEQSHA